VVELAHRFLVAPRVTEEDEDVLVAAFRTSTVLIGTGLVVFGHGRRIVALLSRAWLLRHAVVVGVGDAVVQHVPVKRGLELGAVVYSTSIVAASRANIKPRTLRLNGKVERSHRIDAEEFYRMLDGVVIDDADVFNNKLREWEDY
jgi:hypothetical protein